ncbi:hypothetical protein D3C73_760010 [compost metagenome]
MYQFNKLLCIFFIHSTRRIKPYQFYRTIACCNLLHLRIAFLPKVIVKRFRFPLCIYLWSTVSTGISPILILRIIKSKTDAAFFTSLCQFDHWITFKIRRIDNIEWVYFRMKHRKSVMVFTGNNDITHSSIFCQLYDRFGIKVIRMKGRCCQLIFCWRNIRHTLVHKPFSYSIKGFSLPFIC